MGRGKRAKCRGRVGVGRLAVYSGGRKGQFRGKDCLYGTTGGGACQGGNGIWMGVGLPCLS